MSTALKTCIGPDDHGRTMTLEEFHEAEADERYLYELGRGVLVVTEVPDFPHFVFVDALHTRITEHRLANPGTIQHVLHGSDCRVVVERLESDRHPDLAVYTSKPPRRDRKLWSLWAPSLLVEVISPGSRLRDLGEKPEEYLVFGVTEYWVVDPEEEAFVVHVREGDEWRTTTFAPPRTVASTALPGLTIDLAALFAACDEADAVDDA
jgi:Uma2 family endonuclease